MYWSVGFNELSGDKENDMAQQQGEYMLWSREPILVNLDITSDFI